LDLGGHAHIALHHRDVADDVDDAAGELRLVCFDRGLAARCLAHHVNVEQRVECGERCENERHPAVHADRRGHHQDDAEQRGQLVAHRAEPQPEQVAATRQDRADDGARPALGVIGLRQMQRLVEYLAHGVELAAMGQTVGVGRHHNVGDDAEQAERRP